MNNTPKWLRDHWDKNPATGCERAAEGNCSGRLTKEHVFVYGNNQVQEIWAVIDLCWFHHLGTGLDKDLNRYLAFKNMTPEQVDLASVEYPKFDWAADQKRYLKRYGNKS